MPINNAKHIIGEIEGTRCTIVETGITAERLSFLKDLLENNKLDVRVKEEPPQQPGDQSAYTIGVTDLVFNPVFAIYERQLKTKEGFFVTPAIWKQQTTQFDPKYW